LVTVAIPIKPTVIERKIADGKLNNTPNNYCNNPTEQCVLYFPNHFCRSSSNNAEKVVKKMKL